MPNRASGFGKPRWKRPEPREIEPSAAAPEPSGRAPSRSFAIITNRPAIGNQVPLGIGPQPAGGDGRAKTSGCRLNFCRACRSPMSNGVGQNHS